jgi:hypothetical protein
MKKAKITYGTENIQLALRLIIDLINKLGKMQDFTAWSIGFLLVRNVRRIAKVSGKLQHIQKEVADLSDTERATLITQIRQSLDGSNTAKLGEEVLEMLVNLTNIFDILAVIRSM